MKLSKLSHVLALGALVFVQSLMAHAAPDEATADLVRKNLPVLYAELKETYGNTGTAVNVIAAEDGSIHLESAFERSIHRVYVVLRDVTPDNVESKMKEAAAVLIAEIRETLEQAEKIALSKDGIHVSAVASPHEMIQPGAGAEVGVGINGQPYVSVWTLSPSAFSFGEGFEKHKWIRTSVVLQSTRMPQGGGAPLIVTSLNSTLYEWSAGGAGPNRHGKPNSFWSIVRVGELNPSVRFDPATGTSVGRLDTGIWSWTGNVMIPVGEDIILAHSQGVRLALRQMDQNRDFVGKLVAHINYEGAMYVKESAFLVVSGGLNAVDGNRTIIDFETATGYQLAPSSNLKLGVRYRSGSDNFVLVPEGWSFFGSFQMVF